MAFTEFYCNSSTGSNMNGGSDVNASPSYSATNGGWNSVTGVFTPTSGDPSASVTVGQFANVFLDGATAPVFIGRVTAVNSTTITVSTTAKSGTAPGTAGTGVSINVGGVWKGPNAAVSFPFGFITSTLVDATGNNGRVNFKNNATYSVTAAMTHNNIGALFFQGYTSTVGDGGRAIIDGGSTGASYSLLSVGSAGNQLWDLVFQNNGDSGASDLVLVTAAILVTRCVFANARGNGLNSAANSTVIECEAYNCNLSNSSNLAGFALGAANYYSRCISHDNAGSNNLGFYINGNGCTLSCCVADTNGSKGMVFGAGAPNFCRFDRCSFYNNGSSGLYTPSGTFVIIAVENCLFVSNGAYGWDATSISYGTYAYNNAFYNNTSGQTNLVGNIAGSITLTGDPFTAPSTGNFSLNNTAGAGADCRNAGVGTFTETAASYTGTLGYPDIGAVQHDDAGGSKVIQGSPMIFT